MRRLFGLIAVLGLVASAGCHHHNTCDDCSQDICAGCNHSRMYVVPTIQSPPKAPESVEKMPLPKP